MPAQYPAMPTMTVPPTPIAVAVKAGFMSGAYARACRVGRLPAPGLPVGLGTGPVRMAVAEPQRQRAMLMTAEHDHHSAVSRDDVLKPPSKVLDRLDDSTHGIHTAGDLVNIKGPGPVVNQHRPALMRGLVRIMRGGCWYRQHAYSTHGRSGWFTRPGGSAQ